MIELNEKNWSDFISKNEKVLVDVYGDGCGPCMKMEPVLMDLESRSSSGVVFGKINAMNNVEVVARFGIRSVPALLYFKGGKWMYQESGFKNLQEIQNSIETHLL